MGNPITNTLSFVVQFIFGIYILLVLLRFLLQWVRADFYNPISQFVVQATQPVLKPLRRMVPSLGGLDTASLLLMFALQFVSLWLIFSIEGRSAGIVGLALLAVTHLLTLLIYVFMFCVFVLVILSWIQPQSYNPAIGLLNSLAAPVMRPAQRLVPPMGGLDLSPLAVFLVLGIVLRLFIDPLQRFAITLL